MMRPYFHKLTQLKGYFEKNKEVLMAFIFGSKTKGTQGSFSDWDIAVYFRPLEYLELEREKDYPQEDRIWSDLIDILETDDVDFLVLNRAKPSLVYNILCTGVSLVIKDRKLYLNLLCKTSYEAIDWWNLTKEFFEIGERTKSISEEDKAILREHIRFLENEFSEFKKFEMITWEEYVKESDKRRNIERWVENLVMSMLDIAKIILASERRNIPQSYKDILKVFTTFYIDSSVAEEFSEFAKMRNIIVHEYLGIKWRRIERFIENASKLFPLFIEKVKGFTK